MVWGQRSGAVASPVAMTDRPALYEAATRAADHPWILGSCPLL